MVTAKVNPAMATGSEVRVWAISRKPAPEKGARQKPGRSGEAGDFRAGEEREAALAYGRVPGVVIGCLGF